MRTTKVTALAVLAVLSLAGCAGLRPGVAAEVDGDRITMERLDAFAAGLCTYSAASPNGAGSVADARRAALGLLVRAELAEKYAAEFRDQLVPADIDRVVNDNVAPAVESLPDDEREVFLAEVRDSIEGDQLTSQAAAALVTSQGDDLTQEAVTQATQTLLANWSDAADVELDPRFGTWSDLEVAASSGSLSVPAASEEEPDPGLPAARSCAG